MANQEIHVILGKISIGVRVSMYWSRKNNNKKKIFLKKKQNRTVYSGLGTCVHLWRIHVDAWQNQYNIVK